MRGASGSRERNGAVEVEGASHAVRAGSFVFCSAFAATNFETGMAVGRRPGFPNYGSAAEMQAEYVFTRLNRVLAQVGTSLEHAVESQLYEPDLSHFHDVDGVWKKFMTVPPPRSSMGVKGLIHPDAIFVANFVVMIPDEAHVKAESHAGIRVASHAGSQGQLLSHGQSGANGALLQGQIPSPDFHFIRELCRMERRTIARRLKSKLALRWRCCSEQLEANDSDWSPLRSRAGVSGRAAPRLPWFHESVARVLPRFGQGTCSGLMCRRPGSCSRGRCSKSIRLAWSGADIAAANAIVRC
jgi:enamine deaminase RidA (YjgF/YER057c/UK114 family)